MVGGGHPSSWQHICSEHYRDNTVVMCMLIYEYVCTFLCDVNFVLQTCLTSGLAHVDLRPPQTLPRSLTYGCTRTCSIHFICSLCEGYLYIFFSA